MAFVRFQSPDDTAFTVFDTSRFRVDHGIFLLRVAPLRQRIEEKLEEQKGWDLRVMKLVEENRRLASCLDWLSTLAEDGEKVVIPDLKDEPAIDLVADRLIGDGQYERAYCPRCDTAYSPDEVTRESWEFEEGGVTVRGRRSICRQGHTIHVVTDAIDAPEIELSDD